MLYTLNKNIDEILYPETTSYNERYLQVSDLHKLWYAEYGHPQGMPVIVLHGGPGAGPNIKMARFFDSAYYRIILFDQRGAGKSTPAAEMQDNNTQNLIIFMKELILTIISQ